MRESFDSPIFGSNKADSYQSQRNIIRGLTITSKDELEQAVPKKPTGSIFQKQLRHFSFNESENSSFPSSYNSIKRQESINSKGTQNSNKTSNFISPGKRTSIVQSKEKAKASPSLLKSYFKPLLEVANENQRNTGLPKSNSYTKLTQSKESDTSLIKKRNTVTVTPAVEENDVKSNSTSSSKDNSNCEPPSMKMIGVNESKHTKSSNSKEENYFEIKVTPDESKQQDKRQNISIDRKCSAVVERKASPGLVPPPRKEARRLSENPRNINLLYDVPLQSSRIYKKRKSSKSTRSNSRALISKIMSQLK